MKLQDITENSNDYIQFIKEKSKCIPESVTDKICQYLLKPDVNPFCFLEAQNAHLCEDAVSFFSLYEKLKAKEKEGALTFVKVNCKKECQYMIVLSPSDSFSMLPLAFPFQSLEILNNMNIYEFLELARQQNSYNIKNSFKQFAENFGKEQAHEVFYRYECFNESWLNQV